jgi:hypothetical protein
MLAPLVGVPDEESLKWQAKRQNDSLAVPAMLDK